MPDDHSAQAAQPADAAPPPGGPSTGGSPRAAGSTPPQTSLIPRTELDDAHLLTRAAVGLLTEGIEYFLKNIREAQAA